MKEKTKIQLTGLGLALFGILGLFTLAVGVRSPRAWAPRKINHAPTVRRPGYPLVAKSIDHGKEMTVLISVEGFGGVYRGSGVLIDSTTVLTCYHMVHTMEDDLWIYPYPGKQVVKAHPVEGDQKHDLAILKLEEPVVISSYAVFNTTTTEGQPITVIGNTEGAMHWFVSYGIVSTYLNGYIVTDALIRGGNSGGPWINDAGEVVAISDWGYQDNGMETGVNGGIAAKDIAKFVYDYQHPLDLFKLLFGVADSSAPAKGTK